MIELTLEQRVFLAENVLGWKRISRNEPGWGVYVELFDKDGESLKRDDPSYDISFPSEREAIQALDAWVEQDVVARRAYLGRGYHGECRWFSCNCEFVIQGEETESVEKESPESRRDAIVLALLRMMEIE